MSETKNEMSFLGHLEELRWHLIRSFSAIFIVAVVVFIFQTPIYDHFILAHMRGDFVTYRFFCDFFGLFGIESDFCTFSLEDNLQNLELTGQFMNAIWTSLILGIIIAFPYILYEMWKFISPGLHKNERRKSRGFIFIASFLFFIGVLFSYYIIVPMSVYFFSTYSITDMINNEFTFQSYINIVTNTLIGVSLVFELPVVIYFLSKLGLVTPRFLRKYRKHALVVVLILSAIITPPDVASQIIVAIPILILYEVSIYISKRVEKKYKKQFSNNG